MKHSVRVFAPATVANVAVGFDILGFCLDQPGDEIIVRRTDEVGFRIKCITGTGKKQLPLEPSKNTAGYAALRLLDHLGHPNFGIEMEIHKRMPFGSGLGSSAASAAGGVVAVNELLGRPLTREQLLRFAVEGEQVADGAFHADNVAPSLLGGMILIRSNEELDVHALPFPEELYAAVLYPEIEILTKDARGVLAETVALTTAIQQGGNLATFISALYRNDYAMLQRSLRDVMVEPQRSKLIPKFASVQCAAYQAGALGCSISGAGPSIFSLSRGRATAERAGAAMQAVYADTGIQTHLFLSPINREGVRLLD